MQPNPLTWDDLRVLLAVHRGKSFLAAGKTLGIATSTVARRIEALEQALGRPLVHRGTAGATIDTEALGLVVLGEQMEMGLEALRRAPDANRITGTVRISASEGFVRPLARLLARVHTKYPALSLEIAAESRLADLAGREADIGIRIARTTSAAVIEKFMGQLRVAVFAARGYVERRLPGGRLQRDEAGQHDWIGFDRTLDGLPQQEWMRGYGATRFVLRSSSPSALEEAVVAGMGLGILGEAHGATLDLVRIETEALPPPVDVFIAFHRDLRNMPRVRVVVREIEAEIRRALT